MLPAKKRTPLPSTSQQLQLPLPPLNPAPLPLPPTLATLPSQRIWASLSAPSQAQVRQTLIHILQEVLNEHQLS